MTSDEEKRVRTVITSEAQRLRVTANQLRAHFSAQDAALRFERAAAAKMQPPDCFTPVLLLMQEFGAWQMTVQMPRTHLVCAWHAANRVLLFTDHLTGDGCNALDAPARAILAAQLMAAAAPSQKAGAA